MSLRQKTLKGGAFLVGRQATGILLSLMGTLLVTRIIGPRAYGIFAAGVGILIFITTFGTWGIDVYLIRKPEEPANEEYDQAFTLLLFITAVFGGSLFFLRNYIGTWIEIPEAGPVIAVLALGVPFNLLAIPAIVKLDRALDFKQVAFTELTSQVSYYVFAVPLAMAGTGVWAPTIGFLVQQIVFFFLNYWCTKVIPKWHWDSTLVRQMLGYGLSYSGGIWIAQLRSLVNPVIVARFAGAEAVGFVALSIRVAALLSSAKSVTWRVAMAALAKVGDDKERLRRSLTEGMRLLAISVGLPLAGFAIVAPIVIPLAFGPRWSPTLALFPFIALGCLVNAMFALHSSVLYLLRKNQKVVWFNVVHIVMFAGSAALLVPRLGYLGYGWAELTTLVSYLVIHVFMAQEVGSPSYGAAAIWNLTAVCALALGTMGAPTAYFGLLVLVVPMLFPKERASLVGYAHLLLSRSSPSA
jgi:O-antigen/teichoic acid export membrane protein